MITPLGAGLIFIGIIVLLMGYSLFRSMLPLWGFILIGLVAVIFIPQFFKGLTPSQNLMVQIITFLVAGTIGAVISTPLYYVVVFISGGAMGALAGIIVGAYFSLSGGQITFTALTELSRMQFPPLVNTDLQIVMAVVLGLITGAFAIGFQKFMISASTAFLGSTAVVAGALGGQNGLNLLAASASRGLWLLLIWLILGLIGLFVQYRMRDET